MEKLSVDEILKIFKDNEEAYLEYVAIGGLEQFDALFPKSLENKNHLLKDVFTYPMIFLHELAHLFMALLLFKKVTSFKVGLGVGWVGYNNFNNYFKMFMISFAPLLILIPIIWLPFINIYFLFFSVYSILVWRTVLPSKKDFLIVFLYKYRKEFYYDDHTYSNFILKCCAYLDLNLTLFKNVRFAIEDKKPNY